MQEVIAQEVAANDVVLSQKVHNPHQVELVLAQTVLAQVYQIAMCHKPHQVELVLAQTVLAQVYQSAMCHKLP